MSHTALARRYRPKRFAEVATQEHVSETLRKSVATDRVGHAYLFCGPRGVGKTTLARVLAMSLNCPNRGSDGEPCGTCDSCMRIWSGNTSLDVVEIDAASNRGVDDARSLRERAMYAPSEDGRFKVYIVDEAHMLTREAWNALLKVLEEPPARVIFVFATTEPQKIQQSAAPILSRCQRFDLRRIGIQDIERQLGFVLSSEGASAQADALRAIARKADGGMRDALSLLDQVMALAGDAIDLESVRRVLGLVEEEQYLTLFDILARRDHGEVFALVEQLVAEGYDLVEFYHGLMDALRSVLRSALDPDTDDPGIPEHLRADFHKTAERFPVGDLVRMLSMAADLETSGSLRRAPNPRVLIEMLLLRFSFLDRTVQLEDLLRGGGSTPTSAAPPTPSKRPRPSGRASTKPKAPARPPAARTEAPNVARDSGPPPPVTKTVPPDKDINSAWETMLTSGRGIPPGLGPFLRTAVLEQVDGDRVLIRMPPGPGLEKLQDVRVRVQLQGSLTEIRGSTVEVSVRPLGDERGSPDRMTLEGVRETRLEELLQREPLLKEAVEELDLELLD